MWPNKDGQNFPLSKENRLVNYANQKMSQYQDRTILIHVFKMNKELNNIFIKQIHSEKIYAENPFIGTDDLVIRFPCAEFIEDFGPWKAGYKPYSLSFWPCTLMLIEGNNWEEMVNSCKLQLTI